MSEPVIGKAFVTYATSTTGDSALTGHPLMRTMVVCDICGNKRCPHAHDKRMLCTGINDCDQVGTICDSSANDAIAGLERRLANVMAEANAIKCALVDRDGKEWR